jgi:hypothetical protein
MAHSGHHWGGPKYSSFISEFQSGDFLHAPPCGLTSSHLDFPDWDYPGTSFETTWPRFARGGGGIRPCLVLWIGTCPCWLSPAHGDPGSTQILTWHCGAKSQTDSHYMNSGTMPTMQVLVAQPLQVNKTPTDRVDAVTTQNFEFWNVAKIH